MLFAVLKRVQPCSWSVKDPDSLKAFELQKCTEVGWAVWMLGSSGAGYTWNPNVIIPQTP